ncbi:MAG: hypothetical protein CMB56_000290 [Methanobacteriota archaeon]|nr:MAG: hypothetical protein CMB56_000290 [Euryarchaeota archaeon]|tara:strand:+ start:116 stop:499 length:384 start_codon:yes stop_codon:yes gene_type:complete
MARKGKKSRFGPIYEGKCRICGCEGETEMHHIINQYHAKKTLEEPELITNHGNIVELCKFCHNQTDSKRYRVSKMISFEKGKLEHENKILSDNNIGFEEQLIRAYSHINALEQENESLKKQLKKLDY